MKKVMAKGPSAAGQGKPKAGGKVFGKVQGPSSSDKKLTSGAKHGAVKGPGAMKDSGSMPMAKAKMPAMGAMHAYLGDHRESLEKGHKSLEKVPAHEAGGPNYTAEKLGAMGKKKNAKDMG